MNPAQFEAYKAMMAGRGAGGAPPPGMAPGGAPGYGYPAAASAPPPPAAAASSYGAPPGAAPPMMMGAPAATPFAATPGMVTISLPDGTMISYVRANGTLMVRGRSTVTTNKIPSYVPSSMRTGRTASYVHKEGYLTKLGFKSGIIGESWKKRFFLLEGTTLSYFKAPGKSAVRAMELSLRTGVKLTKKGDPQRIDARAPSTGSALKMMSAVPMGAIASGYGGSTISKDNCLEILVPPAEDQALNVLDSMQKHSMMSMAFGSGRQDLEAGKGRTYYAFGETPEESEEWLKAIKNNVSEAKYDPVQVGKAVSWFLRITGTSLTAEQITPYLDQLYEVVIADQK